MRLDVAAARARYTAWIGGNLPTFVPFSLMARGRKVGKGGGSSGSGKQQKQQQVQREHVDSNATFGEEEEDDSFVRLRRLRWDTATCH